MGCDMDDAFEFIGGWEKTFGPNSGLQSPPHLQTQRSLKRGQESLLAITSVGERTRCHGDHMPKEASVLLLQAEAGVRFSPFSPLHHPHTHGWEPQNSKAMAAKWGDCTSIGLPEFTGR